MVMAQIIGGWGGGHQADEADWLAEERDSLRSEHPRRLVPSCWRVVYNFCMDYGSLLQRKGIPCARGDWVPLPLMAVYNFSSLPSGAIPSPTPAGRAPSRRRGSGAPQSARPSASQSMQQI